MKTIFFGSSNFSLPFFETCKEKTLLLLVVSTEDKPKGRGQKIISNPVKCVARDSGFNVLTPSKLSDPAFLQEIKNLKPDLIITASYGKIIPDSVIQGARLGAINVHPSLLPKYRGAEPIFWQLAHGEKKSGVTIFQLSKDLDQGSIILKDEFPISDSDNYASLESLCIRAGMKLLNSLFEKIDQQQTIPGTKQTGEAGFYARKIVESDERINWKDNAEQILNQIRAFSPHIGAYTQFKGKRVKILEAKSTTMKNPADIGSIMVQGKKMYVRASDYYLKIESLKPEGKSLVKPDDFINGYITKAVNPKFD
jgi:methionyl-tRNA formyltransferase